MDDDDVPLAVALDEIVENQDAKEELPVPCTIITGFLGAGKTTLLKHILTSDHGYRIAVILNEVGEDIGIESSFVQGQEGLQRQDGEWVELTNGCMCCAVKSDFLQALESLLGRPGGRRFDYIVIETTGLANPGPIVSALWSDTELESRISLDGVVTVVDALNIDRQLHEPRPEGAVNEAQLQIAYADIVVLNKLDLAEEEALARAEADIRAVNSAVTVVRTQRSVVDLGLILNRDGYSHKGELVLPSIAEAEDESDHDAATDAAATEDGAAAAAAAGSGHPRRRSGGGVTCCSSRARSFHSRQGSGGGGGGGEGSPGGSPAPPLRAAHLHNHHNHHNQQQQGEGDSSSHNHHNHLHDHHDHHVHDGAVSTVSVRTDVPVDLDSFRRWVDHLLWEREGRADEVYRMKGLLSVQGDERKHMLQAVYELYDIVTGPTWGADEHRATRVVVIGRNLAPEALRASWAQYMGLGSPAS